MSRSQKRRPSLRRHLLSSTALVTAGLATVALAGCTPASDAQSSGSEGGSFTLAALGVGSTETLDPGLLSGDATIARAFQIFEPLVAIGEDEDLIEYVLAESLTPNENGSVWTLTLRDGVTWHDGSPLTVDDVIYTMQSAVEAANYAAQVYRNVDTAALKKIDDLTLEIPLVEPSFLFDESLVDINGLIWKKDTTEWTSPVGTGPFKLDSFTPGQTATFTANEDYWDGAPKIDELEIISIDESSARVNALVSGQVDAIAGVAVATLPQVEAANLSVQNNPGGSWVGVRMNTALPPFDDARVREAMKLLIDREQIVSNVMGGDATLGNDLFGYFDPTFASDIPQREYDPERAAELLAEAGYEDLEIDLRTAELQVGTNEMITLFAASAAEAGVTVNVQQMPVAEFYGTPWMELQWSPTSWSARSVATQMSNQMGAAAVDSGTSETAWVNDEFLQLFRDANLEADPEVRRALLQEAQQVAWEDGGYIIPAFPNIITATKQGVEGLHSNMRIAFGDFDFTDVTVD